MHSSRRQWILFLALLVSLGADRAVAGRLGFGVHAGFGFSDHWSIQEKGEGYEVDSSVKPGFLVGGFATLELNRIFFLELDTNYAQKGSRQAISIDLFPEDDIDVTYRLDYIEVPLLLRMRLFQGAKAQLGLGVGPYGAYLVVKRYRYKVPGFGTFEEEMRGISSWDYGFATSTGLMVPTRLGSVRIEYRYSMGLADLSHPTGPGFPEVELRNYGHYLVLGLAF